MVGVVVDGPADRLDAQQARFVEELLALTGREFKVQIKEFSGNWNKDGMLAAIAAAYADDSVDYVLVTGFVSNQLAATRESYPKPTFLPAIIDMGLLARPAEDGRSGIENLNYLGSYSDFGEDLDRSECSAGMSARP